MSTTKIKEEEQEIKKESANEFECKVEGFDYGLHEGSMSTTKIKKEEQDIKKESECKVEDFDYSLHEGSTFTTKIKKEEEGVKKESANESGHENVEGVDGSSHEGGRFVADACARHFLSEDYLREIQNMDWDEIDCCEDPSDLDSLVRDSDSYSDSSDEEIQYPRYNPKIDGADPKLKLGLIFETKQDFKEAVVTHEVKKGVMVKWIKDDRTRVRGICKQSSCKWVVFASQMQLEESFQIKTYNPEHTCLCWNIKNKNVTSSWIAKKYVDRVRSNRKWKTSEFRDVVSRELRVDVSISQARRAKEKAIALIDGDVDEQNESVKEADESGKEADDSGASRSKISKKRKPVDCGKCGQPGHNKRTCTSSDAIETEKSDYPSTSDSLVSEETSSLQESASLRDKLPVRRC